MNNDRTWCSKDCDRLDCDRNKRAAGSADSSFTDLEGTFLCEKTLEEEERHCTETKKDT